MTFFSVYHVLFIFLLPSGLISYFTENEAELILSLLKKIGINHCIFVQNADADILTVKKFSAEAMSSVYLEYDQVIQLVENGLNKYDITSVHTNVAIIFKEKNFNGIDLLLMNFKAGNSTARMRHFAWLAIVEDPHSNIKLQEEGLILYDCEFIVIHPLNMTAYSLKEIYMTKDKFYSHDFGIWDENYGLKTTNVSLFYRRFDLNQTEVTLAVDDDRVATVVYYIFYYISEVMKFKFNPILRRSITSPEQYDLDINSYVTTLNSSVFQKEVYDFYPIGPMVKTTVNWYVKYPDEEKMAHYYIQPFEINLWVAIALSITIGSILMIIINVFNKNSTKKLIDDVFMSLDCFFNQDGSSFIKDIPSRIICITLRLSAVIIIASYLARILSYLTFKITKSPLRSLKGLAKKGYVLALDNILLPFAIQKKIEEVGILFQICDLTDEHTNHLARMCYEKIVYTDFNYEIYNKNIQCKTFQIQPPITRAYVYLGLLGYRCFKKAFDQNLIRIYESGTQKGAQNVVDQPPLRVPYQEEETDHTVEITQMTHIMLIPVLGIGLAVFINFIEILYYAYVKRKKRKAALEHSIISGGYKSSQPSSNSHNSRVCSPVARTKSQVEQ